MVNTDLALAIIPKIGSSLSIPSSLFIIWEAISDHRKGKGTAIQRALVGMSALDVCASFAWFLSSWAVPEGTFPLSKGNMASCNFQGFLLQLAVGAPLYNCSLALYYLLVIKFNWTNEQLAKIEKYVHGFILAFTVGTSIVGLVLTMYNKVNTVCWVIGYPPECGNSSSNPSDVPCERGDWAWLFGIILFYGPLWVCVVLTIIAMLMIYMQVRNTFRKNEKYRFQGKARRPSAMNDNLSGGRPADVKAAGIPEAKPDGSRHAWSEVGRHESINAAGQICARMSRFSVFSSKHQNDLNDLQAAIEEQDKAGADGDEGSEDAAEQKYLEDDDEHDYRDNNCRRVPTNSEASGGIGLKSGWAATQAAASSNNGDSKTNVTPGVFKKFSSTKSNDPPSTRTGRTRRKQNLFATQAILYSGSFFITWTPSTIWSVAYWFGVGGIGFDLAAASCEPLQGFWNMLIFIRSRPSSQEKLRKVFGSFCCFWLALLPRMSDESGNSSHAFDSTNSDQADRRRASISKALASHNSIVARISGTNLSEKEQRAEHEKSVQFDTEPSAGDSAS